MIFISVILISALSVWLFSIRYLKTYINKTWIFLYSLFFWTTILLRNLYYLNIHTTQNLFYLLLKSNAFLLSLLIYFQTLLLLVIIFDKCLCLYKAKYKIKTDQKSDQKTDDTRHVNLLRRSLIGISILAPTISTIAESKICYPNLKQVEIEDINLPRELDGFRIGQLSDLHIGPTLKKDFLARVCKDLMKQKPDIIFLTGDMIDGDPAILHSTMDILKSLKAPFGVFLIDGNHEYYWNIKAWRKYYSTLNNIVMLNNEHITLKIKSKKIMIAGVTDYRAHIFGEEYRSSPIKAAKSSSEHDYKILLAHRPRSIKEASLAKFNLQVSGHTHGGQSFPFNLLVKLVQPYIAGLYNYRDTILYVSTGTGYWGPSMRLGVPGEVSILKLVFKEKDLT